VRTGTGSAEVPVKARSLPVPSAGNDIGAIWAYPAHLRTCVHPSDGKANGKAKG